MPKTTKPKFGCFITARTSSTRLPQKMLLPIRGKTVIEHDIDRAKMVKDIDLVVLCTSDRPEDDILEKIAKKQKIKCHRGPLEDKMVRWLGAAEKFNVDYFINYDGDDLFCSPELIAAAVKQIKTKPCDYLKAPDDLVSGGFTCVIARKALKKVCELKGDFASGGMRRFFTETGLFNFRDLEIKNPVYRNKNIRMTLDYPEDLKFFRRVFKEMGMQKNIISLKEILSFLHNRPEIVKINFCRQSDFSQNQKKESRLILEKSVAIAQSR